MYEILIAFVVGFASFFSPCVLPIIPGFISSLSGTAHEGQINKTKKSIFISTLYFVLGFSVIFALLGTLIASFSSITYFGLQLKNTIAYIGGFVIIGFGTFLILTTVIPRLNFQILLQEKLKLRPKHMSYTFAWVFGATFAAAWSPCTGPILGSILALAATHPAVAYNSLLAYAMGLGIPFIIIGAFFSSLTPLIKRIVKYTRYFDVTMGAILILIGLVLLLGILRV